MGVYRESAIQKARRKCYLTEPCFAREDGYCDILTYGAKKSCSFMKPERRITNGKYYSDHDISSPFNEKKIRIYVRAKND